jgi:serine/threonine protein kinase
MNGFVFKPGDTILDGYTVERPLGHGGFGEVYHARSAAGKDVALKLIQRFLEVELRGVGHCLNLKHPNLVTIYDVRPDSEGRQWIVMEYVAGESLSEAVEKHQAGMPVEEALRWFEPICQAVEHLHQSGIVHRDLKPGNIFDDRGTIKVGDYGLAKFITASKRSAQTQSVGTLHYMAPEVGSGRYGREVDVYAVGVILYEMLTGRVPFEGESAAEILMKHLTSPPDLDKLPVAFRGVVARMLAKNPNDRYGSVLSALNDLKAKIADHAHGEAIGEPSRYPAYEESIVSRPGMSDWLEAPLGLLRQQTGQADSAGPPGDAIPVHGGAISGMLRRRPLLSSLFAFLLLFTAVSTLLMLGDWDDGRPGSQMRLLLVFAVGPALAVGAFGFLLRQASGDGFVSTALRRRPILSGWCALLMFAPLAGGVSMVAKVVHPPDQISLFVLLSVVPAVLVVTLGFLMRTDADTEYARRRSRPNSFDAPPGKWSQMPADHSAPRTAAEFAPTVMLGEADVLDEQAVRLRGAPRPATVVLAELHDLEREWAEYRVFNLKRDKQGAFIIPDVEHARASFGIALGFCGLVAAGAVFAAATIGSWAFFALMAVGMCGLIGTVLPPLLRDLRLAHVYPRSLRNYRVLRRRLLAELSPEERAATEEPAESGGARETDRLGSDPSSLVARFESAAVQPRSYTGLRVSGALIWVALVAVGVALAFRFRDPAGVDLVGVLLVIGGVVLVGLLARLFVRGSRRAGLGLALLFAAAAALFVTWSSIEMGYGGAIRHSASEASGPSGENGALESLEFALYAHPSGVFACSYPQDWHVEDGGNVESAWVRFSSSGGSSIEIRRLAGPEPESTVMPTDSAASTHSVSVVGWTSMWVGGELYLRVVVRGHDNDRTALASLANELQSSLKDTRDGWFDVRTRYEHPSGVFECRVPSEWTAEDSGDAGSATVRFTYQDATLEVRQIDPAQLERKGGVGIRTIGSPISLLDGNVLKGDLAFHVSGHCGEQGWNLVEPVLREIISTIEPKQAG